MNDKELLSRIWNEGTDAAKNTVLKWQNDHEEAWYAVQVTVPAADLQHALDMVAAACRLGNVRIFAPRVGEPRLLVASGHAYIAVDRIPTRWGLTPPPTEASAEQLEAALHMYEEKQQ